MSTDAIEHYAEEAHKRAAALCNSRNSNPLTVEQWTKHTAFNVMVKVIIRHNRIARDIVKDNPHLAEYQDLRELMLPDPPQKPDLAREIDNILMTENAFATGETIAAILQERFNITIEPKEPGNG